VENRKKQKCKNGYAQKYRIGKQPGESVESVLKKKKRKATVGRICRKGRL